MREQAKKERARHAAGSRKEGEKFFFMKIDPFTSDRSDRPYLVYSYFMAETFQGRRIPDRCDLYDLTPFAGWEL